MKVVVMSAALKPFSTIPKSGGIWIIRDVISSRTLTGPRAYREALPHEVTALATVESLCWCTVVRRTGGILQIFEQLLNYDDEEDVYYWNCSSDPLPRLYGDLESALVDAYRALPNRTPTVTLVN